MIKLLLSLLLLAGCSGKSSDTSSGGGGDTKIDQAYALASTFEDVSMVRYQVVTEGQSSINLGTGVFSISQGYVDEATITWLACVLVHEKYHYITQTGGVDSELMAIARQVECLKAIGAPSYEIRYAEQLDGRHFDSNGNGVLDAEDRWNY